VRWKIQKAIYLCCNLSFILIFKLTVKSEEKKRCIFGMWIVCSLYFTCLCRRHVHFYYIILMSLTVLIQSPAWKHEAITYRIVILYIVFHGCNTLPNMYRCSDLGFWGCHMLKLLTKLNAVGRECWLFATCAWQSKWLSFRYVFLLWIYSGNLLVDCMKIPFFISVSSSLQVTDAAVQHTKWCVFVFISYTVSCFVD